MERDGQVLQQLGRAPSVAQSGEQLAGSMSQLVRHSWQLDSHAWGDVADLGVLQNSAGVRRARDSVLLRTHVGADTDTAKQHESQALLPVPSSKPSSNLVVVRPEKLWDHVHELINAQKLTDAESAVEAALDAYRAKGHQVAIAAGHNLLGWVRRAQGRNPEAARLHMQALTLSLKAGGPLSAGTPVARAAYEGLSRVQASFNHAGRTGEAAALLRDVVAAAEAARVRQDDPGRKRGERRLQANAWSAALAARAATAAGRRAAAPPGASELQDLVIGLVKTRELPQAEAAATSALGAYEAEQNLMAIAVAHNLLGMVRQAQRRYHEAARRHMRALALALQCGGLAAAKSPEAEAAYRGLGSVQAVFLSTGRPQEARALARHAVAAADAAGIPKDRPARLQGERLLWASARPGTLNAAAASSGRRARARPRPIDLQILVHGLLSSGALEEAAAAVTVALEAYQAERHGMAAAAAQNLLAQLRREQGRHSDAARGHLRALSLALGAGGLAAEVTPEAEDAYVGLSAAQAALHRAGKARESVALLHEAEAAADAAGVPRERPGRRSGERRLREAAWPELPARPPR